MLDMKTQFGKMIIADDGSVLADDALKKEIQDNIDGDIIPEIASINNDRKDKEIEKDSE